MASPGVSWQRNSMWRNFSLGGSSLPPSYQSTRKKSEKLLQRILEISQGEHPPAKHINGLNLHKLAKKLHAVEDLLPPEDDDSPGSNDQMLPGGNGVVTLFPRFYARGWTAIAEPGVAS